MSLIFRLLSHEMTRDGFDCGEPSLNTYLQKQALQDMRRGFSTVVVASEEKCPCRIVGYYTLSAASIPLHLLPEATARKMPRYPAVPAIRLGRLAVTMSEQKQGIGNLLILDALRRCCRNELAWAVMTVDAKNNSLVQFYEKFMFIPFLDRPCSLWILRKQADSLIRICGL